jgi:phosphoglycerate dehydrogenase-like enzyme
MLGNKEFNKIKKNIILINCARAELIKNEALIKAIKKKKVSYASIDVINPEPNYDTVKPKKNYNHIFLNEKNFFIHHMSQPQLLMLKKEYRIILHLN